MSHTFTAQLKKIQTVLNEIDNPNTHPQIVIRDCNGHFTLEMLEQKIDGSIWTYVLETSQYQVRTFKTLDSAYKLARDMHEKAHKNSVMTTISILPPENYFEESDQLEIPTFGAK
jgi:uncharacterized protein YjaG (DUF416 family)